MRGAERAIVRNPVEVIGVIVSLGSLLLCPVEGAFFFGVLVGLVVFGVGRMIPDQKSDE